MTVATDEFVVSVGLAPQPRRGVVGLVCQRRVGWLFGGFGLGVIPMVGVRITRDSPPLGRIAPPPAYP